MTELNLKVKYGMRNKTSYKVSERVKGALRPSNAKKLYMDEKSTEKGEIIEKDNRKVKGRKKCYYFV